MALLASLPAFAALPFLNASVDPSSLKLGPTPPNKLVTDNFEFHNDTEGCDLRIRITSGAVRDPAVSTVCFGLDNTGSVPVGGKIGCRVHYLPTTAGTATHVVEIEYTWGLRCRQQELTHIEGEYKPKLDKAEQQLWDLTRNGPDFSRIVSAKKDEQLRHQQALEKLAEALKQKKLDTRGVEEARLALQRGEQRQADRVRVVRDAIFQAEQAGPGLAAWNQMVAALTQQAQEEKNRVEADINAVCSEIGRLEQERDRAMDELRQGYYCSECKRPRSRIERGGESFQGHLRRVRGRSIPGSQEMLDAEWAKYQKEIDAARDRCTRAGQKRDQVKDKWLKKGEELNKRKALLIKTHREKLERLRARLQEYTRQWTDEGPRLRKAVDDAELRHRQQIEAAEKAIADEKANHERALERFKEDEVRARAAHEEKKKRIEALQDDLRKRWERDRNDLERRLETWKRVSVDVAGESSS